MTKNEGNPYGDIIHLPHHVSAKRPQMPIRDRAAQFSPFAAVTGHDAAIAETARITDAFVELDETAVDMLGEKLNTLMARADGHPFLKITYFQPDSRKEGGAYLDAEGQVKKVDPYEGVLFFTDGRKIQLKHIVEIEEKIENQ